MISLRLPLLLLLWMRLLLAASESRFTPTPGVTPDISDRPASPAPGTPGGAADYASPASPDTVTKDPAASRTTGVSGAPSELPQSPSELPQNPSELPQNPSEVTQNPSEVTEVPSTTTGQPLVTPEDCPCDLTPRFCDIGCCCDVVDCGVANLSTVFSGCPQKTISGVCIEKWLMFRANVDSSLVTVTDSLFCVQSAGGNVPQSGAAPPKAPALGASYHFSSPESSLGLSRGFYKVDDVIQTYYSNSSVRGVLRQPSPATAAALCVSRNPAKFLRSGTLSCTRMLTPQSCTTDPSLSARSYFSDLSLMKIPITKMANVSDFLIPVTPLLSEWPAPVERPGTNFCMNVTKKVEFVITYTDGGEITDATVNVVLGNADMSHLLLQTHSVKYQLETPKPTAGRPGPAAGLQTGSGVRGRFGEATRPLTMAGFSAGGECSADPDARTPVRFAHDAVSGCAFSSPSSDCSELRSQIETVLRGVSSPEAVAMNAGSQPDWARVLHRTCPVGSQETCDSGCTLPHSLSIRVLWAHQGSLDLPQRFILGAKYLFKCRTFKCPIKSPLYLTAEVTFIDTTVYPQPPRGSPRPFWKFPFGFFTGGSAELDGHTLPNGGDSEKVTGSLMLFIAMLLTGLEFFSR